MTKRSIILYWLLLFIPTLALGIAGFHLLRHEQERINQAARTSALERAQTLAETLQAGVGAMEDELRQALQRIPSEKLRETLFAWEESNPLIRNVFIWKPGLGLQYPHPAAPVTSEQGRFVIRYQALFSGRIPWQTGLTSWAENSNPGNSQTGQAAVYSETQAPQEQAAQKNRSGRDELVQLAQNSFRANVTDASANLKGGWLPWFSENNLYILGWVRNEPNGIIYGAELELMTVLSRLIADFPAATPPGVAYALLDGRGRVLHQSGQALLKNNENPEMTVSLAPYLPNWQIAVYFVEGGPAATSKRSFLILSGLLLAIFVMAVILGGSFLLWQAHRNMLDAQQKTSFVSNVSHELKTPLTTIRMYTELLNQDRIKDPDKKKNYLQVILTESERLTRLVNNVLDFSRLEQGRKKYHLEELDLAAFIREWLESHGPQILTAGLEIKEQIPEACMLIRFDRDAVEQVLLNLLDNAVKYAAAGAEIRVELDKVPGYCRLRIMDRGPGVPLAHRTAIFEKFHRVDDSLTAKQPGSGLGLSIARGLMRGLGGDLRYDPREGGGSCFIVLIPYGNVENR
jgi:signal transduction histidine kinase